MRLEEVTSGPARSKVRIFCLICQRDPLAVLMDGKLKFEQKLNYIHNNPLTERWNLAQRPEEYFWSSAAFYETGIDHFGFLTHFSENRKALERQALEGELSKSSKLLESYSH